VSTKFQTTRAVTKIHQKLIIKRTLQRTIIAPHLRWVARKRANEW
jgi:hypothetical protein